MAFFFLSCLYLLTFLVAGPGALKFSVHLPADELFGTVRCIEFAQRLQSRRRRKHFFALAGRGPAAAAAAAGCEPGPACVPRSHWLAPRAALSMFAPRGPRAAVAAATTAHCAKRRRMRAGLLGLALTSPPNGLPARLTGQEPPPARAWGPGGPGWPECPGARRCSSCSATWGTRMGS